MYTTRKPAPQKSAGSIDHQNGGSLSSMIPAKSKVVKIGAEPTDDTVSVPGYGRFTFRQWLNLCDWAIQAGPDAYQSCDWATWREAVDWLRAAGFQSAADIRAYRERRRLFEQPGDPSRIVRCRVCGAVLTNPVSRALRTGPEHRGQQEVAA